MTMRDTTQEPQTELVVDYDGRDLEAMSFTPRYSRWIARLFGSFVGESILEVGAGRGNFTRILLEEFPDSSITVLEPSQQFEMLQKNEHIQGKVSSYLKGTLEENMSRIKDVDTIIYNNVLEHIEDDARELELMYSLLPKGGTVIVFSPALPFLMSEFDRSVGHFRRYMKHDLDKKVQSAGFSIPKSHYVDMAGVLPWYIKYTLMNGMLSPNDAKLYDTLAVPVLSVFDPSRILPFGKNVLTIGTK
jgi:SAM-dependent methyltransferase